MANALSDPGLVILAQKALISAKPGITKAKAFTLDISNEVVAPGSTLKVAVYDSDAATAFNSGTNNYGTGSGSITTASVQFTQYIKSYNFTDAQLTEVDAGVFARAGEACGVGAARAISAAIDAAIVENKMTGTAITLANGTTALTKALLADIAKQAKSENAVLALSPAWYYDVLPLFDAAAFGGNEAIKNGVLDGLFGFKAVVPVAMPDGVVGAVVPESALVVAVRDVPCASTAAYDVVSNEKDADSGFGFQIRKYADPATGTNSVSGSVMVGAGIVDGAKIQKIKVSNG